PMNAFVQNQSPPKQRGEILACQSFISFLGVAVSAGLLLLLTRALHLSPRACFVVVGVLTAGLAVAAIRVLPDFLTRFAIVVIARCLYRIRISGLEHIPEKGPALLVANHVTWADPVLLSVITQRRIRFVMSREIMESHFLKPTFKLMRVIPISANDPPRRIAQSLREARQVMDEGFIVCIFAEGMITRNGNMREFRPGLERIVRKSNYPIIPLYIGGAWGSIFSYFNGKLLASFPKRLPYPIYLAIGAPLPATATRLQVRQAVMEASQETFDMKKDARRTLIHQFVRLARKRWRYPALSDTSGKRLTFGTTLIASIALSRKLSAIVGDQEMIGVVLPATVGGALTNVAITMTGRVPVNLNFTASREAIDYSIKTCAIKTTISSRAFLEKLETFTPPAGTVYLEDIMPSITAADKRRALVAACLAPVASFMTYRKAGPDDLATIIFSSGSTGIPKGVMLSHHNIISNIEAFGLIFGFRNEDRICGILPLFHSFGFTATLWGPLTTGFSAHYHPNPIDGGKIAEIVREEKLSILMTTPTFLLAYIRRAKPEDFASLRCVVTGAEKLKTRVADAFQERFGIRPLEGYGATELSPVVGANVADVDIDGRQQVGTKDGSIGHPFPGIAVKVVDPSSGEALGMNQEGLLLIKGPNVMRGYLNDPERTAAALQDGWYNTGDIGRVDADGFIFLTDRLSRFSKIGGEMIPHMAIEEKILEALGAVNPVIAVTAAPDERKGEQLVVLYTDEAGEVSRLQQVIKDSDLPNLWKPRPENFIHVDALPTLGSGKLDIQSIKETARVAVETREAAKP
ncbi:MAG: AMP-binding protein, partial [Verrucomicrobia bacterium]|nr:AMP-binding protein [Verrucomicrobiota bacterium]